MAKLALSNLGSQYTGSAQPFPSDHIHVEEAVIPKSYLSCPFAFHWLFLCGGFFHTSQMN